MTDAEIWVSVKAENRRAGMVVRDNFRTGLIHADTLDLVGNAEPFEQWQIEGEQRFSDVEAGETILFKDDDVSALLSQQPGDGRPGRTTADNQDITYSAILHL